MSYHTWPGNESSLTDIAQSHRPVIPALAKATGVGFFFGGWFSLGRRVATRTSHQILLAKGGAFSGAGDAYMGFTSASMSALSVLIRNSSNAVTAQWGSLTNSPNGVAVPTACRPGPDGKPLFIGIIADSTTSTLVMCAPDEGPVMTPLATPSAAAHSGAFASLFTNLARGTGTNSRAGVFSVESLFLMQGAFPQSGGAPDPAVVAAIVAGTTTLDALRQTMAGAGNPLLPGFHYPLDTPWDLADAWGGAQGPMTDPDVSIAVGRYPFQGRQLRPRTSCKPKRVGGTVSGLTPNPAAPSDPTQATTRVPIEPVTLSGASGVVKARVRLLKRDGTVHVAYTDHPGALANGIHAEGELVVAGTPGFLFAQFIEVNASNVQVGPMVPGSGVKGTGIVSNGCSAHQSQGVVGSWSPPTVGGGVNNIVLRDTAQVVSQNALDDKVDEHLFSGGETGTQRGIHYALRWAANQIDSLFPGYPILFANSGKAGEANTTFAPGGVNAHLVTDLAAYRGLKLKDSVPWFLQTSSNIGDLAALKTTLESTIAHQKAAVGFERKACIIPATGISGSRDSNYNNTVRQAYWEYAYAHLDTCYLAGLFGFILNEQYASVSPSDPGNFTGGHPHGSVDGCARYGTMMAYALMAASGWLKEYGPRTIKGGTLFQKDGKWRLRPMWGLVNP